MPDLPAALDAALRARYPVTGLVKRPATHRQGLTARMNALEKQYEQKGQRKGTAGRRAAEAAGISPRTWREWRAGTRKPGAALLRKLEAAYTKAVTIPKLRRKVKAKGIPDSVTVSAKINWNGYKNRTEQRSTTLGGMRNVMNRVIRAWAEDGAQAAAEAFETGAAQVHNTGFIHFEGGDVAVDFPWN